MTITDLVAPEAIVPALKVISKKQALQELAARAAALTGQNERSIFEVLLQREKLGTTAVGYGVAIPHGRLKNLKETLCAFVRTQSPVPFESPDGQPVRLVLAMLVPEHATEQHLELLSDLAQMFSDRDLRERLLAAGDIDAAHSLLTQWSPYAPPQRSAAL